MSLKDDFSCVSKSKLVLALLHGHLKLFLIQKLVRWVTNTIRPILITKLCIKRIQVHSCTYMIKEVRKWNVSGEVKVDTDDDTSNNSSIEQDRYINVSCII